MHPEQRSAPKLNIYVFGLVTVVALSFFFIGRLSSGESVSAPPASRYPFLAQRLFEPEHNDLIINFTQLREVMKSRYEQQKIPLGIYFEYLPTGSSINVNDQFEVELGSLAKVPAIMAVYKNIEAGDISADTVLTVKKEHIDSQFGSLWKRGVGTKITVEDAIRLALTESDNTAVNMLLATISQGTHEEVFQQLDLPKTTDGIYPTLSPKSYASVFRNLYLSSYINYKDSNIMLDYLSKTIYTDKLPAGVPKDVKVSHKIGVFASADKTPVYNDCGIVYVPKRPYILCMMVAADEDTARNEMIAYAKMTYSYVSQVRADQVNN